MNTALKNWSPARLSRASRVGGLLAASLALTIPLFAAPKVILISLDGATPRYVNYYLQNAYLSYDSGLGLLSNKGTVAQRNYTVTPSLTAAGHMAIATGAAQSANDINSNYFYLMASPFPNGISGFGAPIGGYDFDPLSESEHPTARPVWRGLLDAGQTVVTATWPGSDGVNVTVPGISDSPIIQASSRRKGNYTIPYGVSAGGLSAQGFSLTNTDFSPAPRKLVNELTAAGHPSYSTVLQKTTPLNTFTVGGVTYNIRVAALDTTDDGVVNYDTLVFYDESQGIQPGPYALPSTGPAYVKYSDHKSAPFYLEGSSNKAGTGYYVSFMTPLLAKVRIAQYSANCLPRTPDVLSQVDDINTHVGFWANQADYGIPQRSRPGFSSFPQLEVEAIYEDQVAVFVDYQTRVALRAIELNPDADLLMVYIEEPDGSEHQFMMTDARQASDPSNPDSIGAEQNAAQAARFQGYILNAYQKANDAVDRIIKTVGTDINGTPKSDIIVVSDHGFNPFHSSVSMQNILAQGGSSLSDTSTLDEPEEGGEQMDELTSQGPLSASVSAVTSGPAVNLYINLAGRQPGGTVSQVEYLAIQKQLVETLKRQVDTNQIYTNGLPGVPLFQIIHARRAKIGDPNFGLESDHFIGQDGGDVVAVLTPGYNFDGTQNPPVQRAGDAPSPAPVLSLPTFYGGHGYDSSLPNLSAIFFAAGPDIRHGVLKEVRNIDIAPTIDKILGVEPDDTVQGKVIEGLLKSDDHHGDNDEHHGDNADHGDNESN